MEELPDPVSFAKKAEDFVLRFRYPLLIILLGLILIGIGAFFVKSSSRNNSQAIEVLESTTVSPETQIFAEVGGAVIKPGVYSFDKNARVEDLLAKAGGFLEDADTDWVAKNLNRAAKLVDGQKVYIPTIEETTNNETNQSEVLSANTSGVYQTGSFAISGQNTGLTNINSASLDELDKLPGIGPVYGQKIIDQRPYSNIDELNTKKVVPKNTFEKIKNMITI